MTTPPAITGLLEAALYAEDLAAAAAFYGTLLGLTEIAQVPGRHVFYRCGPTILLVFRASATAIPSTDPALPVPTHGASGQGHVCFAADNAAIDRIRDRLAHAGIAIEADFRWPNGARSLYVRDPAGNSVEFAEPHLWEAA
jgi:catechol 2,3-dioxygenase-like lactoylglutathione lyase family enzyme